MGEQEYVIFAEQAGALATGGTSLSGAEILSALTTVSSSLGSKQNTITPGTSGQYWRGDESWQSLNVSAVQGLGSASTNASSAFDAAGAAAAVQANLNSHTNNISNPHLTTAGQVGLSNVANTLQLAAANNLSDVAASITARINLGLVGDAANAGNLYLLNLAHTQAANVVLRCGSAGGTMSATALVAADIEGALSGIPSQTNYGSLGIGANLKFGSMVVTGTMTIGSNLTVGGSVSAGDVSAGGILDAGGDLNVNGIATLGVLIINDNIDEEGGATVLESPTWSGALADAITAGVEVANGRIMAS